MLGTDTECLPVHYLSQGRQTLPRPITPSPDYYWLPTWGLGPSARSPLNYSTHQTVDWQKSSQVPPWPQVKLGGDFKTRKNELSILNGCILCGSQVVVHTSQGPGRAAFMPYRSIQNENACLILFFGTQTGQWYIEISYISVKPFHAQCITFQTNNNVSSTSASNASSLALKPWLKP